MIKKFSEMMNEDLSKPFSRLQFMNNLISDLSANKMKLNKLEITVKTTDFNISMAEAKYKHDISRGGTSITLTKGQNKYDFIFENSTLHYANKGSVADYLIAYTNGVSVTFRFWKTH